MTEREPLLVCPETDKDCRCSNVCRGFKAMIDSGRVVTPVELVDAETEATTKDGLELISGVRETYCLAQKEKKLKSIIERQDLNENVKATAKGEMEYIDIIKALEGQLERLKN